MPCSKWWLCCSDRVCQLLLHLLQLVSVPNGNFEILYSIKLVWQSFYNSAVSNWTSVQWCNEAVRLALECCVVQSNSSPAAWSSNFPVPRSEWRFPSSSFMRKLLFLVLELDPVSNGNCNAWILLYFSFLMRKSFFISHVRADLFTTRMPRCATGRATSLAASSRL